MCLVAWARFEFARECQCLLPVVLSQHDRLVLYRTQAVAGRLAPALWTLPAEYSQPMRYDWICEEPNRLVGLFDTNPLTLCGHSQLFVKFATDDEPVDAAV